MQLSVNFAPSPESAGEARRAVAGVLGESRLEDILDTTLLLTSELVTNALLHARTQVAMTIVVNPPRVRVEVCDDDSQLPEMREAAGEETSGRGLLLVEMLAAAWGVRGRDGGKCVWFEVAE